MHLNLNFHSIWNGVPPFFRCRDLILLTAAGKREEILTKCIFTFRIPWLWRQSNVVQLRFGWPGFNCCFLHWVPFPLWFSLPGNGNDEWFGIIDKKQNMEFRYCCTAAFPRVSALSWSFGSVGTEHKVCLYLEELTTIIGPNWATNEQIWNF